MKRVAIFTVAAAGALLSAASASAHHSFAAEFDRNLPVTVTGTVTKVEWMNPHARFYIDAKDDAGKIVNWDFELASPNGLMRQGWTRNNPYPAPGQYDHLASALDVFTPNVCGSSGFPTLAPPGPNLSEDLRNRILAYFLANGNTVAPPCHAQGPFTFGGEVTQYPHVRPDPRPSP